MNYLLIFIMLTFSISCSIEKPTNSQSSSQSVSSPTASDATTAVGTSKSGSLEKASTSDTNANNYTGILTTKKLCNDGVLLNGTCWYLSPDNTCDVCANQGGIDDQTWTFAGANPSNCREVANALKLDIIHFASSNYLDRQSSSTAGSVSRIDACSFSSDYSTNTLTSFYGGGEKSFLSSGRMICACKIR